VITSIFPKISENKSMMVEINQKEIKISILFNDQPYIKQVQSGGKE
jgi:hypothetical protein